MGPFFHAFGRAADLVQSQSSMNRPILIIILLVTT